MNTKKRLSSLNLYHKAEEQASVLPSLMMNAEKTALHILSGDYNQRKPGTGEKFWQYRDYHSFDRQRDIDWRQSAKNDRLFVREKEWQMPQTTFLWCQNNDNMAYHSHQTFPTKQNSAALLTLTLGFLLTRGGTQIAPLESSIPTGHSSQMLQILGQHILYNNTQALPDIHARKIKRHSGLILTGDFLTPIEDIEQSLAILASTVHQACLIQVLDPAEYHFPFTGRIIFEQTGSKERHNIENAESIRAEYQEKLQHHIQALQALCQQYQWYYILHITNQDTIQTLHNIWRQLSPESVHNTETL